MSVPLKEGHQSEYPLILFTTCIPAAEGVVLWALVLGGGFAASLLALLLTTMGMIASIAHLAKPFRAPRSLANLASSWLSGEIIAVSVFWAILVLWCGTALGAMGLFGPEAMQPWTLWSSCVQVVACLMGAVLLFVIARAYHVSTRPAWCGYEGLAELWACAFGAGSVGVLFVVIAAGWESGPFGWVGFSPVLTMLVTVLLGPLLGLLIDVLARRARKQRLESMAAASDERIPLTLKRYRDLSPRLRRYWAIEAASAAVMALAIVGWMVIGSQPIATIATFVAFCGQLYAHGSIRGVFYDTPVPVRYVAPLRK